MVCYLAVLQVTSDGGSSQHGGISRVAAVGPYIQSSQVPPFPAHQEVLVKPAYPDGTSTLPAPEPTLKPPPRPVKPASGKHNPLAVSLRGLGDQESALSLNSHMMSLKGFAPSKTNIGGSYGHSSTLPRMSSSNFSSGQWEL